MNIPTKVAGDSHEISRRLFVAGAVGSSAGALWGTGFSRLALGNSPRLFVTGAGEWQVALLEHRRARVLILYGEFRESPEQTIQLMLGSLRQYVDVMYGSASALAHLPPSFANRLNVSHTTQLGPTDSTGTRALDRPIATHVGAVKIALKPIPIRAWDRNDVAAPGWVARIEMDQFVIALGPTLEALLAHASLDSDLLVAPVGSIGRLLDAWANVHVVTNVGSVRDMDAAEAFALEEGSRYVVPTFPEDVAAFTVKNGRLTLPRWSQPIRT